MGGIGEWVGVTAGISLFTSYLPRLSFVLVSTSSLVEVRPGTRARGECYCRAQQLME